MAPRSTRDAYSYSTPTRDAHNNNHDPSSLDEDEGFYDSDARSRSDTGFKSDSDDDDDERIRPKSSEELARYDRQILEQEEEREMLLQSGGGEKIARKAGRKAQGLFGKKKRGNEESIYDVEGGEKEFRGGEDEVAVTKSRRSRFWKLATHIILFVVFVVVGIGAYTMFFQKHKPAVDMATLVSNGTSLFAPTTILISLDGFRADFLQRGLTPTLNNFIRQGVSPRYMLPSFPSVTFPNHYTLVTGLHPESHGIVGNSFWDPELKEEFYYTDPARSMQPKWWSNEPLWETAEEQNVPTAIHMWPGSEAHIGDVEPAYVDKFNGTELLDRKIDRIFTWLDTPGPVDDGADHDSPRPQLIAAYVPNVDADGHLFGPNSTEILDTIRDVDDMFARLLDGLVERNLTDIVNVVVVSDHGMATTSNERLIQLEDLLDVSLIDKIDGWPHYGLRPKNAEDIPSLYESLAAQAEEHPGFDVYLRDENMPERYHFTQNDRIAPLWIMPRTHWAIVTLDEYNVKEGQDSGAVYHPRGIHGYDNEDPMMRAIFIARGPAFPHEPNSRVELFQNIEVYNMICDSIGIEPKPNNGTIRLPLQTVGLHSDYPEEDVHPDYPVGESEDGTAEEPQHTPEDNPSHDDEQDELVDDHGEGGSQDDKEDHHGGILGWFHDLEDTVTGWVDGVVDKITGHHHDGVDEGHDDGHDDSHNESHDDVHDDVHNDGQYQHDDEDGPNSSDGEVEDEDVQNEEFVQDDTEEGEGDATGVVTNANVDSQADTEANNDEGDGEGDYDGENDR